MSQRRGRRSNKQSKPRKVSLFKLLGVIVVLLLITLVVVYQSAVRYLHSDDLRNTVAKRVSEVLGARAELSPLHWSLLHMENDTFQAHSDGAIVNVEARGIELNVGNGFLINDAWEINDALVESAMLEVDLRKDFSVIEKEISEKSWLEKQLPEKVDLNDLTVIDANAKIISMLGELKVEGTALTLQKEDYGYSAKLKRGDLSFPLPIVKNAVLGEAKLRVIDDQRVVLDMADLSIMESGRLELDGEVDYADEVIDYEINGWLTGLELTDLVNPDWKKKLSGKVESRFNAEPTSDGDLVLSGNVVIRDGKLTALPVLDTIAAYTGVRDFKTLRFSEFRCDYERRGALLKLSNIYLHCNGLMRIEGDLEINGSNLDGAFDVGLNPGTLSHIPGAEDIVFRPGKEGMSWATVRIGGTVGDISEDLTDRLMAAAGQRIFEMVGGDLMLKLGGDTAAQTIKTLQGGNIPANKSAIDELLQKPSGSLLEAGSELLDSDALIEDPVKSGVDVIQRGLGGLFGDVDETQKEKE